MTKPSKPSIKGQKATTAGIKKAKVELDQETSLWLERKVYDLAKALRELVEMCVPSSRIETTRGVEAYRRARALLKEVPA